MAAFIIKTVLQAQLVGAGDGGDTTILFFSLAPDYSTNVNWAHPRQWSTSETTVAEKTLKVWEMVHRVKVFLARLDNLSSRPKTHKVEVKIWIHKLSSDLHPLPQYRKKKSF